MKTIEELQSELHAIAQELEQLKKEQAPDAVKDFERISMQASRNPVTPHPLENFDRHTQKCYLTFLLAIMQFDTESFSESLLLIHRIAFGIKYLQNGKDLREEYIAAQMLSSAQLDETVALFKDHLEGSMLILECLLLAGVCQKGRQEAISYVARMAWLFGISEETVEFLSQLAAVILTNDPSRYRCGKANLYTIFDCYLNTLDFECKLIYSSNSVKYKLDEANKAEYKIFLSYHEPNKDLGSGHFLGFLSDSTEPTHLIENILVLQKGNCLEYTCTYRQKNNMWETEIKKVKYCIPISSSNFFLFVDFIESERFKDGKPIPIGVETHPLNNRKRAKEYFEHHQNK